MTLTLGAIIAAVVSFLAFVWSMVSRVKSDAKTEANHAAEVSALKIDSAKDKAEQKELVDSLQETKDANDEAMRLDDAAIRDRLRQQARDRNGN